VHLCLEEKRTSGDFPEILIVSIWSFILWLWHLLNSVFVVIKRLSFHPQKSTTKHKTKDSFEVFQEVFKMIYAILYFTFTEKKCISNQSKFEHAFSNWTLFVFRTKMSKIQKIDRFNLVRIFGVVKKIFDCKKIVRSLIQFISISQRESKFLETSSFLRITFQLDHPMIWRKSCV
jgi:hypothetical protein